MKTIFKKSLVALALTGVAMSAQAAVTFDHGTALGGAAFSTKVFSKEGVDVVSALQTGNSRYIVSKATGTAGDVEATPVRFSVGDLAANSLIRVQLNVPVSTATGFVSSFAPVVETSAGAAGTGTVTVFSQGADFVILQVGTDLVATDFIKFPDVIIRAADLKVAGQLSVTVSAESGAGASLVTAETKKYWEVVSQNKYAITTDLSETIDVASQRKNFTNDDVQSKLTIGNTTTTADYYGVTFTTHKYTLTGDFSFLKDTDTTTANIQAPTDAVVTNGNCQVTSIKASELKVGCDGAGTGDLVVFNLDKNAAGKPDEKVYTTLNETSFKVTSELNFSGTPLGGLSGNTVVPFNGADAGSWEFNGSDVTIPYMVFGTVGGKAYNQVIQLTNKSSIEGAIYVDIYDGEGKAIATNTKLAVTAKANTVTNLATELKAIVAAAKYEGKVSVRVIAEVPSATAQIYAAYQDVATSERAIVVGLKN